MYLLINSLLFHYCHNIVVCLHNPAGIGAIVKKEAKRSESPSHLKDEPHSPEVKHKVKPEQLLEGARGYEEVKGVVPAEKMRQLQLAHKELRAQYEELKEKMEYIISNQSETAEDTKAIGTVGDVINKINM